MRTNLWNSCVKTNTMFVHGSRQRSSLQETNNNRPQPVQRSAAQLPPLIQGPTGNPQFLGHGLHRAIAVQREFHGMALVRFVEHALGRGPGSIPIFLVHIFLLSPEPADSVSTAVWSLPAASSSAPVLGRDQTVTRQHGCLRPLNRGTLIPLVTPCTSCRQSTSSNHLRDGQTKAKSPNYILKLGPFP